MNQVVAAVVDQLQLADSRAAGIDIRHGIPGAAQLVDHASQIRACVTKVDVVMLRDGQASDDSERPRAQRRNGDLFVRPALNRYSGHRNLGLTVRPL